MSRITIRNRSLLLLLATLLLWAGCGREYDQRDLAADSPQATQVREMIRTLRQAGGDGVDEFMARHGAEGLSAARQAALRATLLRIARAETVELKRLDSFGKNVCRASLRLGPAGRMESLFALLIVKEGQLRWAGPN